MGKNAPTCNRCAATGGGVLFNISSKFGFGTYCVPCEKSLEILEKSGGKVDE